ncbi:sensor histidine kinase [Flavobacterium selenitireducens]|uniref:sensor histidine kinase n=1 Tax=Flavobacterium selenitireducens TaxID=2722704 RepID=UPI00168AB6B0|nr:ATP-binding protein [Flavobacterium selenitireducens]MBD3581989.1 GHKL domain-containing protein [Flavobacterium selenitireducens]
MKFHTALFLRIFLIIALLGLGSFLVFGKMPYSALLAVCVCVICITELFFYTKNRALIYDKTILSILHEDFSAGLPESFRTGTYTNLYQLYQSAKKKQYELSSRDLVFASLLDNVDSAILILKKSEGDWAVFLMNDYFSRLFGVPKLRNWQRLREKIPSLAAIFEQGGFAEMKSSAEIRIDEGELQTFSIQTSCTQSFDELYYVVLLDSIQKVVERKEKQAWVNLMNVISHELMNSLTPIQSLSQSLNEIVQQETPDADDLQDIRDGLSTIVNRSNHLTFFVENYRKLTMLPTPAKKPTNLNDLIGNCVKIMVPILKQEEIAIENNVNLISAIELDAQQVEQVFINLITNSILALKEKTEKKIHIESWTEPNRVFIGISDTGKGIENEIRDKIFLPFFTTRKDGAGIGLTLSKNIVEAHGGYLNYAPRDGKTEFVVCLVV